MKKEKKAHADLFKKRIPSSSTPRGMQSVKVEPELSIGPILNQEIPKRTDSGTEKTSTGYKSAKSLSENPMRCCMHPRIPLFMVDLKEPFEKKLVKPLQVKERILAAKRLKAIGQQTQSWVELRLRHKVTSSKSTPVEPSPVRQEERQFVIERVMKYLTDI